jgi:hypothetical protein
VIVLVLNTGVLMECLMFPFEPALLVALRAFRVRLTIEGLSLGIQRLVALLVFLVKLVMDSPVLPPTVMSKAQGSGKQ